MIARLIICTLFYAPAVCPATGICIWLVLKIHSNMSTLSNL